MSQTDTPDDQKPQGPEADEPSEPAKLPDDLAPLPKPDSPKKLPPSRMEPGGSGKTLLRPKDDDKSKSKKGGCGCLAVFTLLVLLPLGLAGTVAGLAIRKFGDAGYQRQQEFVLLVEEPPAENTLFLGASVTNDNHLTNAEVAYVGGNVVLKGIFRENVSVRGAKVHCAPGSIFEKNLEVYALVFHNEGQIVGELTGQIVHQSGLPKEEEKSPPPE